MSEYLIGVELAGSQLKIAAFKKEGSRFKIAGLSKLIISGDLEKNRKKLLEWKNSNLPTNAKVSANLAVPESTLYLKELLLPKVSEKQIGEAVYWEMAGNAPFPKGDIICEWRKLNESEDNVKVLAICARESAIQQILSIFEDIGIKIFAVEPAALSFERIAEADFEPTTLLITVEHEETNLLVLKNGMPVFTTSISTPILAEKKGKRRLDKAVIEDLAKQAYKTIEFWQKKNKEKISQVIITGDIARKFYGLADAVNKIAKIPALMASKKKLRKVTFSKIANAVQLRYLIPIGAFFRFVEPNDMVNLLPADKKRLINKEIFADQIKRALALLSLVNSALIALTLIALFSLTIWNRSLIKNADQKEVQIKNHAAQEFINEVNDINSLASIIDTLLAKQKDAGTRLDTISEMTPKVVTLTTIDFGQLESEEWKISGVGDREDILLFYDKLSADAQAKDVSMPYSNLSKQTDNEFEIKILW